MSPYLIPLVTMVAGSLGGVLGASIAISVLLRELKELNRVKRLRP